MSSVECYGVAAVAIPISSEFELETFEKAVAGKTSVRLMSWSKDSNSQLTFERLKHVKCLDMHDINLTILPPEIGLCSSLECLDIRNNCLESLPPELSQCLNLKTLLYSGNSLYYTTQIQALSILRQLNQAEGSAPPFKWTQPNASFTIITWNLIPQTEATQANFPLSPSRYLNWEHRAEAFIHTILSLKPHLVCVQEVEEKQLKALADRMRTIGYGCASSMASRARRPGVPIVGVATFFLKARLIVEKAITVSFADLPPNENITKLQLLANDAVFQVSVVRLQTQSFFLINAGLHACKYEPDVILAQMHIVAQRVDSLNSQAVICGSLGFLPGSPAYQLMNTGEDPSGKFKLRRTFRSAYQDSPINLDFTEWYDGDEFRIVDYIWITQMLQPAGYVIVPTKDEAKKYHHTAPNSQWMSNHIPIGAGLDIRIAPQEY